MNLSLWKIMLIPLKLRKSISVRSLFIIFLCIAQVTNASKTSDFKVTNAEGFESLQQNSKITGVVKDATGEPIIGAGVLVKGTTRGTMTDLDGKFSLENIKNGDIIRVSYIGYTAQDIVYKGQRNLNIQLREDSQNLDEVVVTALGIKRDKKALGYSASTVKSDEITKAGTPMNALSALYGKTSGLQLQGTAAGPSGGLNIKVRNAMTLNESSTTRPLMVVDGIPIYDANTGQNRNSRTGGDHGTGINDINPEDIESIDILKGAKAAVLYGSEGANGVMLITTKSGKKKGFGIDFGANYTMNKAAFFPEYQNEFGSGSSAGSSPLDNLSKDGFYMMADPKTGKMVESLWKGAGGNFGPAMDGRSLLWWDDQYRPYTAQQNNLRDLFRTGSQSNINLAMSNSGDLGSFRLSYNFRDYNSVSVGANNKSHSFNFSGDMKVNDFIKLKVNTSFTSTKDHNAPYAIQDLSSYGLPREQDVNLIKNMMVTEEGYNYFSNEAISKRAPYTGYLSEYYWSQKVNENDFTRNHLIQSLNMDVKINDQFSWTSLGGIDWTVSDHEIKHRVNRPLVQENKQGYYGIENTRNMLMYAQTSLNYNQTFAELWNVSAMLGGAVKRNLYEKQNNYVMETFAIENWFSLSNTREDFGARSSRERGKHLLQSVFVSAQLAYANQLYLELQARNDWSSILPPKNNSYPYPGASLSWIFTEAFKVPTMNFGKVRASWADVGRPGPRYFGNVDFSLGSYGGRPTMGMGDYLPPADFAGSKGGFPVPNLKPERKREYEFGFETSFLPQNRINVDFSYFTSNTYNQIITLPVPSSSGVKTVRLNAGDIGQTGFELSLNTKPVILKDFTWSLGLNLANYKTKINKLAKGVKQQTLWGATGATVVAPEKGEYGEIWIYPYKINDKGERIVNQTTGVYEYDRTKTKKVGKITPDILGGLTTELSYKGFTLSAVMDFQFGATMVSQSNMYMLGNGTSKESLQFRDEKRGGLPYYMNKDGKRILLKDHKATTPADSKYTYILHDGVITPGITPEGKKNDMVISAEQYYSNLYWQGGSELSEDQVFKSDYISLRTVTLSYNLPKSFLQKLKIQSARVNVFGNNLCYLYKAIPNVTPESTLGTNSFTEFTVLPGIRSIGLGLNVSF